MLNIPVTAFITQTTTVPLETEIPVSTMHVQSVIFDFDNTEAYASVAIGTYENDVFNSLVHQLWKLSGNTYGQLIMSGTFGRSIALELMDCISENLKLIYTDKVLYDTLTSCGDLKVIDGDFSSILLTLTKL